MNNNEVLQLVHDLFKKLIDKADNKQYVEVYWKQAKEKIDGKLIKITSRINDISISDEAKEHFDIAKSELSNITSKAYSIIQEIELKKLDDVMLERIAKEFLNFYDKATTNALNIIDQYDNIKKQKYKSTAKSSEDDVNMNEGLDLDLEYNTESYAEYFSIAFKKIGEKGIVRWNSDKDVEDLQKLTGTYLLYLREQRTEITALSAVVSYLGSGIGKLFTRKISGQGENLISLLNLLNTAYESKNKIEDVFDKYNIDLNIRMHIKQGNNGDNNGDNKDIKNKENKIYGNDNTIKDIVNILFESLYLSVLGVFNVSYSNLSTIIVTLEKIAKDNFNEIELNDLKKTGEKMFKIIEGYNVLGGFSSYSNGDILAKYIKNIANSEKSKSNKKIDYIYSNGELIGESDAEHDLEGLAINTIRALFNYITDSKIFAGNQSKTGLVIAKKIIFFINVFGREKGEKLYEGITLAHKMAIEGYENILQALTSSTLTTSNNLKEEYNNLQSLLLEFKNLLPYNYNNLVKGGDIFSKNVEQLKNIISSIDTFKTMHYKVYNALLDSYIKTAIAIKSAYPLRGLGLLVNGLSQLSKAIQDNVNAGHSIGKKYTIDDDLITNLQTALKKGSVMGSQLGIDSLDGSEILNKQKNETPMAFKDLLDDGGIDTDLLTDLGDKEIRNLVEKKLKNNGNRNASKLAKKGADRYDNFKRRLLLDDSGHEKYGYASRKILSFFYDIYGLFIFIVKFITDVLKWVTKVSDNNLLFNTGITIIFLALLLGIMLDNNIYLYYMNNIDHFIRINIPFIPIQPPSIILYLISIGFVLAWFILALFIILNIIFNKTPKLLMSVLTQDRDSAKLFFGLLNQILYIFILYILFSYFLW